MYIFHLLANIFLVQLIKFKVFQNPFLNSFCGNVLYHSILHLTSRHVTLNCNRKEIKGKVLSDDIATTINIPHSDYTYSNGSYSMQPQKLINEFLLKHSRIYISEKMKIYGRICSALKRAWINVCCVHVSQSQLLCETRKSALNFQTIDFC